MIHKCDKLKLTLFSSAFVLIYTYAEYKLLYCKLHYYDTAMQQSCSSQVLITTFHILLCLDASSKRPHTSNILYIQLDYSHCCNHKKLKVDMGTSIQQ